MHHSVFLQLVIIQIKQQTSVVIKHRSHLLNLHSIVLVENTKIPAVAVSIQNQSIQNAHPAEGIAAAKLSKYFRKPEMVRSLVRTAALQGQTSRW